MTIPLTSPQNILTQGLSRLSLPVCDHYAGSEKFARKAIELQKTLHGRFDVTIDLEDGAQIGKEREHLEMAIALLREYKMHPGRRGVRVHPIGHPSTEYELQSLAKSSSECLSYITIPKAQGVSDIEQAWQTLQQASSSQHKDKLSLNVLIETFSGIAEVDAIAAHRAIAVLDFGIMDYISEYGGVIPTQALKSPGQFEQRMIIDAKTKIVAAAARHGKVAAHNVCTNITDPEQAYADALRARNEYGFLRMWSIHPSQIEPILRALTPSPTEITESLEILTQAQDAAWGPISYKGTLHDRGSYRIHWYLLERAYAAGAHLPEEARAWFSERQSSSSA